MKNNDKLVQVLEKVGLTEHESLVYYASLSLGPSPVLAISRTAGVKRTTVYSVIESLKMKGLMAEELKGFKTIFFANDPDKLEAVLGERKDLLDKNIAELKTLYNLNDEQGTIRYYEGLEAVKGAYNNIISEAKIGDYYLVVADVKKWSDIDPNFFYKYKERRSKLGLETRLLFTDSELAQSNKRFQANFSQKVKILPQSTKLSTSLIVTPNKVIIQQYNLPISIIMIQTKSAIELQKEMFEIMWNALPD